MAILIPPKVADITPAYMCVSIIYTVYLYGAVYTTLFQLKMENVFFAFWLFIYATTVFLGPENVNL